ncbi:flagellar export chaperone FliS [Paenibacillus radicis (ex Gao et al. 2016)]|uniref:Flagellar secretion chaperone FliS n=1 Tax=Paenibacillus radicis (ex Gao et al. 2016) TaxID=1737354 RepID=A0A917M8L2_9BACL|nr:flagellar export chaperone FliS [Paenibacillus radicis (ex Gao et al. 2016)]GGG84487.1 flagellar protein FliS [Paenibacillus radicis (ex Gao et al. 2016)]
MLNSPYQKYQQSSVQTATPGQLIIMLYEGAIRFTKAGIEGIRIRDYEMANKNFKKSQAIVNELIASLNHEYEISNNLLQIYEYMLHLLIESNMKKNAVPANEVLEHLLQLRDAWKQVIKGTGQFQSEVGSLA